VDHMTFIVNLGGTFYGLAPYGTPFVVPGGISNVQPVIQVNDSALSDNAGDYDICVKVTNNSTASGCHHLDFRISPYGFVDWSSAGGPTTWHAGVGWTHAGGGGQNCQIKYTAAAAFTCTRIQYQVNDDAVSPAGSSGVEAFAPLASGYPGTSVAPCLSGTNTADGSGSVSTTQVGISIEDGNATTLTIIEMNVFWSGIDPFPGAPTC